MRAALAIVFLLAVPGVASGHPTSWYWSEDRAELKYLARYNGTEDVACAGWGHRIRSDDNPRLWLYKHFDCLAWYWDGDSDEDELHVLGRRRFVVYD
ncbi:MAG TPA: hypothetical protein VEA41_17375 [Salinarimonas sp.]|nr:hypothetical protein [Salinarimonas sp.]